MPPSAGAIAQSLATLPVRIRIAGPLTRTWWNTNASGTLRSTDVCAFLPNEHNLITTGGGITRGRVAWNWHNWLTGHGTNGGSADKTWDAQDEIAGVPITQLDVALYNTEKPLTNSLEWLPTGATMGGVVTQALNDAKTSGHGGKTRTGFDFWWGPDESLFNENQTSILTQNLTALYLQAQQWESDDPASGGAGWANFDRLFGGMITKLRAAAPNMPLGMQASLTAHIGTEANCEHMITHAMATLPTGNFSSALQIVGIFAGEGDQDVAHGGNGKLDALMAFLRPGGATSYTAEEAAADKNKATLAERTARARTYAVLGTNLASLQRIVAFNRLQAAHDTNVASLTAVAGPSAILKSEIAVDVNLPSLSAIAALNKALTAHDANVASLVTALQATKLYLRTQAEVEANLASFVRQLQFKRTEATPDINVATVAEVFTRAVIPLGTGSPYVANVSTPSGSPYVAR